MTTSPQIERPVVRVVTKVIVLPGVAASRRKLNDRWAKGPNYRDVHPLVRYAFYVFIFSLLFEWPNRPIPMELPTLIGAFYLAITLLQPKVCYRHFPRQLWFYALYLCYFALLCFFVRRQGDAIKQLTLMVQIFFLMWSGYNLMRYRLITKAALVTLVIASSVISVMQLLGVGTTDWYEYGAGARRAVLGQNPNNLANNISLSMVALMGIAFGRYKTLRWARYLSAPLAIIMAGAIFYTGSRGALLALGGGFAAFAIRGKTLWEKAKSLIIVLLVLVGLVWAVLQEPSLALRYKRTIYEKNMAGREKIFPAAWDMFTERPFIGWGPIDNMYELGKRVHVFKDPGLFKRSDGNKGVMDTHNMFLDALTSTGLLGTIPLYLFITLCMLAALRARRGSQGALPLAMVVTIILIDMSGNWIASKFHWLMMSYALVSAGFLFAVNRRPHVARRKLPSRSLLAAPASVYVNNSRKLGIESSAPCANQQGSLL